MRDGKTFRGRYELIEILGVGGEARVVKALDRQHGRLVALKIRSVRSDLGREDLLREARVLFGLTPHQSLPLVREDFFDDDQYVVVMDWVDGIDLARLLRDKGIPGLPLSSVLTYLAEAAEALSFLHTHDPPIIHGDVKPANLILTRGGHVKLVDFGLSSTLGTGGLRQGTAGFRAPELAAGAQPSRASDVYSLAATAFALLTGAPPAGERPSWAGLEPAQAARLEATISDGLAAEPDRRPATPGELVERLRSGWASTLPTGVITFCMSDMEDSTRLWESHPTAMAEALVRHDELIASVVEAHGGRFLKSMGEGDSTTSVFVSATQAVRAAIAATRSLADQTSPEGSPIRARFGLHTGEAQLRGGVYFGTTVNLVARVRGAGAGGEVLLSETTASLVDADLPAGYAIVELGQHRLKGIEKPEAIKALTGPGLMTASTAAECPYRGLLAFEPRDRRLFFGREEVVDDVLARIVPGRLLAVIGASGSGKSSLLRAGVLAAVEAGEVAAVASARLISPGPEPSLELGDDEHELLIVDQFEELYTQCHDPELRTRFVEALLTRRGPVVIGVRADFYGELSVDSALAALVARNQVLLGPMSDEDLRRAIAEPARLAGLRLEPGLTDLVLRDVAGEPGALPLMSHALRETWERRDGRTLTVEAYEASGGVSSALAKTADAVAAEMPEAARPLLRNVFLRLTELGDDVEDTRRRARVEELVPQGTSADAVRTLLERLAEARLVTLDEGTVEVAHEVLIRSWPTLREWLEEDREGIRLHRRLGDAARLWNVAGREPADLYRGARLQAALEWTRDQPGLLNETEREFLSASVEESARTERRQAIANLRLRRALSGGAVLLVAAIALLVFALLSRHDAVGAEASARSQALAAEAETQVTRDPQLALLLGRAALKLSPTPQAELAVSEALDANTAVAQLPSFGVQGCLVANYLFLFDQGRIAADNTCNGQVVFANLQSRRIVGRVRVGASSTDMVLGPSGQTLIIASGRNLVSVGVRSRQAQRIFTVPFPVQQVASGRYLAVADADTVGLIDARSGRLKVVAHGDASANPVDGVMWASPDLLLIVCTGQSRGRGDLFPGLSILNVENGKLQTVDLSAPPELASESFLRVSPDGRTWVITGDEINANNDETVATTWAIDAGTRRVLWVARGPMGGYASPVQFSPDGRLVAVGYSTGEADVLAASTGHLVVRDTSSASIAAGDLAIPPSDGSLVTVSLDGVFRIWSMHGSQQLRFQAPADAAVDFPPSGTGLVLIGDQGEIVDRSTGAVLRRFPGFPASSVFQTCGPGCVATSPELGWLTYLDPSSASPRIVELHGRTGQLAGAADVARLDSQGVAPDGQVVTGYADGDQLFAEVIDPRSGHMRALQTAASSDGCGATTPSFTPDSSLVAIDDGCIHLVVWELRSGRIVRTITLPGRATGPAHLSPDGRYVLAPIGGGSFVRVDLATGRTVEIPGEGTEGDVLAISPNGRFYAVGHQDGTVDEYDGDSLQLVRVHTLANPIQALVFSPGSAELAVEDTNNVVWLWDTCAICENPTALARRAAQESIRQLTPGERATFDVG